MATDHNTPPLSPTLIEKAEPRASDYELRDSAAPGLALRVSPNARKVFRWYVVQAGKSRAITIGPWSKSPRPQHVTLAEARVWLDRLKVAHGSGAEALAALVSELQAARPPRSKKPVPTPGDGKVVTVDDVIEDFLEKYIAKRRLRPEQAKRTLDHDISPVLGKRPIAEVDTAECVDLIEAVAARAPVQAGAVLTVLKQLFKYAKARRKVLTNPTADLLEPAALGVEKGSSDRYLSPEEITAFWRGLDSYKAMTSTVRVGLKLILLTGVRSQELLLAEIPEVNFEAKTWTIPVEHQKLTVRQRKNARPFVVPLAPVALKLFSTLKVMAEEQGSPSLMASYHNKGNRLTEKSLNHAMRRLFVGKDALLSFEGERPTPHDLRRTMRTHLGDTLGVDHFIAERCLNHSLGKITDTYDRGTYLDARREAMLKWAAYVDGLVSPEGPNVVRLPTSARAS